MRGVSERSSGGRSRPAEGIDEIDLGALGHVLWSRKGWIIGLTIVAAAIAFLAVNLMTPRYKSEARVLIEARENIFLRPDAERAIERNATVDQEAVTSQVQLMLSRDLARGVVKKLKLAERAEFDPVLRGPSMVKTVLGLLGLAKDPMNQTPEERVLKSYFERLAVFQVEKSRVIAIEFESEDPELAALAANTIAESYLGLQQSAKLEQSRSAGSWLAGEIENLRAKVAEAEAKVEQYRTKASLFVGTNNTTLSNQAMGDTNAQLAAARAQKADAEAKARVLRDALRAGTTSDFSEIVNSDMIRRLSEQRITLRAQLAEQASTLLDQHPRIKELRAQIADLERQIRAEADRIARSLESDAKLAGAKVEFLTANLEQVKKQAASSNEQDVQLRALERDAKSQRDLLESYLAKYREASARDNIGAASPEARIISSAIVSNTPAWPKKVPTVLIATFGMFALSVAFVLSSALLGGAAVGRSRPLPDAEAADVAGAAPDEAKVRAEATAAEADPQEPWTAWAGASLHAVEAFADELRSASRDQRRVAVFGTQQNIATAVVSITLARSLAQQMRVVLVDLALDTPNLSAIVESPEALGVTDLLAGSASIGQVIARDRHSRAHIITAGQAPPDNAAIGSQQLAITLEALARSYDVMIIDAGLLRDGSVARFAELSRWAALVVNNDKADEAAAVPAREQLTAAGFATVSVLPIPLQEGDADVPAALVAA